MKLSKFAIAAFALSMTGAMAGYDDKSKQQASSDKAKPAGYADQSGAKSQHAGQKDTQATASASMGADASARGDDLVKRGDKAADPKVRQIQQALKDKGHDPGQVDGVMGQGTKDALRQFQQAQNLPATGDLTDQTLAALGVQGGANVISKAPTMQGEITSPAASANTGIGATLQGEAHADKSGAAATAAAKGSADSKPRETANRQQ